jgi:hypothetical protein
VIEGWSGWELSRLLVGVSEVLDEAIGAREDLGFVAVLPAHQVRRRPVLAEHLENLTVARQLALVMPANHQTIAWACPECLIG